MKSNFKSVWKIIKWTPLSIWLLMSFNIKVNAQEVSPTPTTPTEASSFSPTGNSQELGKADPVNTKFEQLNGIQQQINNGIVPLQPTTCRTNSCLQLLVRQTQQGTEILGGIQFGFGGSSDETYANAAQYRAETERQQAQSSYRMLLFKEVRTVTDDKTYRELLLNELGK